MLLVQNTSQLGSLDEMKSAINTKLCSILKWLLISNVFSGVWYMHCHFERHLTWGMMTTFIVKDGKDLKSRMLPPPSDMPPC